MADFKIRPSYPALNQRAIRDAVASATAAATAAATASDKYYMYGFTNDENVSVPKFFFDGMIEFAPGVFRGIPRSGKSSVLSKTTGITGNAPVLVVSTSRYVGSAVGASIQGVMVETALDTLEDYEENAGIDYSNLFNKLLATGDPNHYEHVIFEYKADTNDYRVFPFTDASDLVSQT